MATVKKIQLQNKMDEILYPQTRIDLVLNKTETKSIEDEFNSKLEKVKINGSELSVTDKSVNIPVATTDVLGVVKPDGDTISIDGTGKISTKRLEWGNITGDIENQNDLKTVLDEKLNKDQLVTNWSTPVSDLNIPSEKLVKEYIDNKVSGVYHYKGSVETYSDLPTENLSIGDVYNIKNADKTHGIKAGDNVAWAIDEGATEGHWDVLSGTVDLENYYTKDEVYNKTEIEDKLDDKLDKNTSITGATKTKITYDSNGLVTAGADLGESDIPDLHLAKITDVTATVTEVNELHESGAIKFDFTKLHNVTATSDELNCVSGVTSSIQDQLDSKQGNLTEEQLSAVNSGITAIKVGDYDTHLANNDIHVTTDDKTTWNNKLDEVTAGSGIKVTDKKTVSVEYDNSTIKLNSSGQLSCDLTYVVMG